jgi:hypothetical protein
MTKARALGTTRRYRLRDVLTAKREPIENGRIVDILMALTALVIVGCQFAGADVLALHLVLAGLFVLKIVFSYREGLRSSDHVQADTRAYRRFFVLFWVAMFVLSTIAKMVTS